MDTLVSALLLAAAYLIGAVPFGLLIARAKGIDIRTVGSKNIGATNVFRCVGAKYGILVFVLDMLKGIAGTLVGAVAGPLLQADATSVLLLRVLCGAAAMIGHIFPVYLKFKGGKGVSTALGLLFGVAPAAAIIGFGGWIVLFVLSRYVSLASCLAAVIVGATVWTPLYGAEPRWFCILITVLAVLAVLKHAKNIKRLCTGTENRFAFTAAQRAARDAKRATQAQQEITK